MAKVALKQISKSFGDVEAINNMTMTIADGEFVVLLGPTGAGKTTTLRLIAGLEKPEKGQVEINDVDVTDSAPAERDVCFVFQQYSLYPHYTVFENIAFPLRAPGRNISKEEIKKRVNDVAKILHIEHKLGNKSTQLSGGEMQRVAIGRALVRSPSIFLMDEPLSSLDAKMRDELRVQLKHIQRDLGASILYVTHDQMEAMTLADRIGVLSEGVLVQIGTPREVYETPANIYVAQRLGSPQINLISPALFKLDGILDDTDKLGIRPEDIIVNVPDGVSAEVISIEHLGVETIATLKVATQQIKCLLDINDLITEGSTTTLSIRQGAFICFDKEGNRLT